MNLSARAHKNLQSALAGALLGGLMASPRAGAAAVLNGLTAFTQGVLPFLFPFSCLAQLLACGRRAPLWALRLTGMLGGSPTGARLLAEVGDERAARRSAMMTGGVSPMFFAGTLALWLDSRADGTILLASHLGALALGGLLGYLYETQKTDLGHLDQLTWYRTGQYMELDLTARRNLELTETLRGKEKRGSIDDLIADDGAFIRVLSGNRLSDLDKMLEYRAAYGVDHE